MSSRSLFALGALVLAFTCEQFSSVAIHTLMFTALREGGETLTSVGTISMAIAIFAGVGCIIGALLAFFAGPRVGAIIAAVMFAVGALIVTIVSRSLLGYSFVSLGVGMLGPAGYVIAAEIFFRGTPADIANRAAPPAHRFAYAVAFVAAVQAGSSVASMIAPAIASVMASGLEFTAAFALAGVVAAVCLALVVASAILSAPPASETQAVPASPPYRAPSEQASHEPMQPSRVAAVLVLLAAGFLGTLARNSCQVSFGELRGADFSSKSLGIIYTVESVSGLLTLVPILAIVLARLTTGRPSRLLGILGAGFAVLAVAAILQIGAISVGTLAIFMVAAVAAGAGAAMTAPVVSGLLLGTLKPRNSALVVGGFYLGNQIVSAFARAFIEFMHTPLLVLGILIAIGGAVVSLLFAKSGFASLDA